jgi:3-dehydroquinate dehydratase II
VSGDAATPVRPVIAVLHGPNLNLLGQREPHIYGTITLAEIDQRLRDIAAANGADLVTAQSNGEGALIDHVHAWRGAGVQGAVVNAGAYSHTSLALRDALTGVAIPFVEVHLSNVYAREPERRHSMLAPAAVGVICGFGAKSYELGLLALLGRLAVTA